MRFTQRSLCSYDRSTWSVIDRCGSPNEVERNLLVLLVLFERL